MKINKKYIETREELQKLKDIYTMIKEEKEKQKEELHAICNDITNWKERTQEQTKKLKEQEEKEKNLLNKEELNRTKTNLLMNNLLHIQRELLKESAILLRNSKYYLKPFGEKTREKLQNEIKEQLINKYGIELYVYIHDSQEYNRTTSDYNYCYNIEIDFVDYYYIYELKKEKIQVFENEEYLFYYNEIKYTTIDKLEDKATKLNKKHKESEEKINKLKEQIEKIRQENNKEINGFLNADLYIDIK